MRNRSLTALLFGAILTIQPLSAYAEDLVMAVKAGADTADPQYSSLSPTISEMRNIYETLIAGDAKQNPTPALAESWKAVNDTTWEFHLRHGVKWHNGQDFSAKDVKFSLDRVPQAAGPASYLMYTRDIQKVEIVDDYTIRITTPHPAANLPSSIGRIFIVNADVVGKLKGAELNDPAKAIGTGPYKFVSWTANDKMELTRFDDYWGGKAPWKNVTIREIPNDSARMSALLAGDVDFVNQVQPADVGMLEKRKGIKVFSGPSAFNFLLFTDMRKTSPQVTDKAGKPLDTNPFLKPEVRQAISESIDRQLLVDRLMDGQGSVATQAVPEGIIGYNPSIPKPVYDPAHAKELLAKAGYPDGFGVELTCTSDRLPNDGRICEGLGQFLTRIGIAVKVNAIPRSVFFSKRAAGDFSLFMHGWGTVTGETSQVLEPLLHTNDRAAGAGSWNVYGYSNPKMDADVDGANQQIDPAKRKAMLEDAMKLVVSDRAMIPLVNINTITAARSDKISDFTPRLDEDTLPWFIKPAK